VCFSELNKKFIKKKIYRLVWEKKKKNIQKKESVKIKKRRVVKRKIKFTI